MSIIMSGLPKFITVIGILAFIVSCVTEVLKLWKWFDAKIPTELSVIVTSLIVVPATLIRMAMYYNVVVDWYVCFASVIAAFVVAMVAMSGWERVMDIFDGFVRRE